MKVLLLGYRHYSFTPDGEKEKIEGNKLFFLTNQIRPDENLSGMYPIEKTITDEDIKKLKLDKATLPCYAEIKFDDILTSKGKLVNTISEFKQIKEFTLE